MDIWLDDLRPAPKGWEWVTSVDMATEALAFGEVEAISLDNDLGENLPEGSQVVNFMQQENIWPAMICLHSSNPVAVNYMRNSIQDTGLYQRPVPIEFQVIINDAKLLFPALMFNLK